MVGKREIKAFALAPLPVVTPVLLMFGFILVEAPRDGASVFGATLVMVLLIYGVTLLIGLPVHWMLQRKGQTALVAYLGFTVLAVFVLSGAFAVWNQLAPIYADGNPHSLRHMWSGYGVTMTLVFAALASLSASIFWCAAVMPPKS